MRLFRVGFFAVLILIIASFVSFNTEEISVYLCFAAYHVKMPIYSLVLLVGGFFLLSGGLLMYPEVLSERKKVRLLRKCLRRDKK